jgi:septal ring-binding cell division protein DamX
VAASPRGTAPAVALHKAHEQFGAKRYKEAARSWNEWAKNAPAGSWTVQIAAISLDKASSTSRLGGVAGREGTFLLPSGALPDGLSPVCVGIYPSEAAARRAAATMPGFPGSWSRPIAKPLSSLSR